MGLSMTYNTCTMRTDRNIVVADVYDLRGTVSLRVPARRLG